MRKQGGYFVVAVLVMAAAAVGSGYLLHPKQSADRSRSDTSTTEVPVASKAGRTQDAAGNGTHPPSTAVPEESLASGPQPESAETKLTRLEALLLAGDAKAAADYFDRIRSDGELAAPAIARAKQLLGEDRPHVQKSLVIGHLALLANYEGLRELLSVLFADWGPQGSAARIARWREYDANEYMGHLASGHLNELEGILCTALGFVLDVCMAEWVPAMNLLETISNAYKGILTDGHPGPVLSHILTTFQRPLSTVPLKASHPLVDFIQVIGADTGLPERVRFQARHMLASRVCDLLSCLEALTAGSNADASKAITAYLEKVPAANWELSAIYDALILKFGQTDAITVMQLAIGKCKLCDTAESAKTLVSALLETAANGGSMFTDDDDALAFAVICSRSVAAQFHGAWRRASGTEAYPKLLDPAEFERAIGTRRLINWQTAVGDRYRSTTKAIFQGNTFNMVMELDEPLQIRCERVIELVNAYADVTIDDAAKVLIQIESSEPADIVSCTQVVTTLILDLLSRSIVDLKVKGHSAAGTVSACCYFVSYAEKLLATLKYPALQPTSSQLDKWQVLVGLAKRGANGEYNRHQKSLGALALEAVSRLKLAGSDLQRE
jgi:hypothetical protein